MLPGRCYFFFVFFLFSFFFFFFFFLYRDSRTPGLSLGYIVTDKPFRKKGENGGSKTHSAAFSGVCRLTSLDDIDCPLQVTLLGSSLALFLSLPVASLRYSLVRYSLESCVLRSLCVCVCARFFRFALFFGIFSERLENCLRYGVFFSIEMFF